MARRSTWSHLHFGSLLLNVTITHVIKSPQCKLRAFFSLNFVYLKFFSFKKERISSALVLPHGATKRMMVRMKFMHALTDVFGLNLAVETLS